MTNYNKEMEMAKNLYSRGSNTNRSENVQTNTFQKSMVVLWEKMAILFNPQWLKNNGPVGARVFQDWVTELQPYGPQGVLRGLEAVKRSGSSYVPNLNKFVGFCAESGSGYSTGGEYGPWETCPYTGRQRRLKMGIAYQDYDKLAARLGDGISDTRTDEEIRLCIERYIAAGQPADWTLGGKPEDQDTGAVQ